MITDDCAVGNAGSNLPQATLDHGAPTQRGNANGEVTCSVQLGRKDARLWNATTNKSRRRLEDLPPVSQVSPEAHGPQRAAGAAIEPRIARQPFGQLG
jgi:hypothetical protein